MGTRNSGWDDCLRGHDIECVAAEAAEPERAFVGPSDAGLQRPPTAARRGKQSSMPATA